MVRREAPPTTEGWYALHDMRRIDWSEWADAPQRARDRAIEEGRAFLDSAVALEDAEEGATVVYSMLGHKADLMIVHLRPTPADIDALERRFERTELARFTERSTSYVSVTEASGYSEKGRQFIEGELDDDSGLANYMRTRLYPTVPDAEHVCFYPMDKRRDPEYNWYDLPFDERAEHMDTHGDIGRDYAGKVTQMITGSIGLDDWEWGVTLWADDLTQVKKLLYEMRFDPSSSKYAEFGPFYVGSRMAPADLDAFLAGERLGESEGSADHGAVPATPEDASTGGHAHGDEGDGSHAHGSGGDSHRARGEEHGHAHGKGDDDSGHDHSEGDDSGDHPEGGGSSHGGGRPPTTDSWSEAIAEVDDLAARLATAGFHAGEDYDPGAYGLLFESERDAQALSEEVSGLAENFDHYDTHLGTGVRAARGETVVVSIWDNEDAAQTASGFLTDIDGVETGSRGHLNPEETTSGGSGAAGAPKAAESDADIQQELAEEGVYAGKPHGEDVYALVLYSTVDVETLFEEVSGLRGNFDHYDTHVKTAVYETTDGETTAVASLWETADAAETAAGFLSDLPGVVRQAGEGDGFGTMGMFYTVKQDYRSEFVDTFDDVEAKLETMDGHRETSLLVNHEDDADMFIASQWDAKADAMEFFRSADFRETVEWGREVLADTPRHVFLA